MLSKIILNREGIMLKRKVFSFAVLIFSVLIIITIPQSAFAVEGDNIESQEESHQSITEVTENQYLQNISGIKEVNNQDLIRLIKSDDSYLLLIGYKGCPYCREFSKVLSEFKDTSRLPIYYVNLEKSYGLTLTSEDQVAMRSFFNEKIGLKYSPTLVKIVQKTPTDGFVGSETTLEELQTLND